MKITMRLFLRNGIWQVAFNRKDRRSLGTRDKAVARRLFRKLKQEYLEKKITVLSGGPPKKTLQEFTDEYLDYRADHAARFTHQTDSQALRRAIKEFGGDTPLSRLTTRQIDLWLAQMGKTFKRTSANVWFRHFKAALSTAVKWGYLRENPCKGVELLKPQEDFPRFLNREEVIRLLAAEPDPEFRCLWRFLIAAGCRRSEALQITVQDVDVPRRRIRIGQTKNGKPKYVIINEEVGLVLWEMLPDLGKLFPWQPDSVTHHFLRTARAAGLTCRLHDLRHTFGSWLVMEGVPLLTVSKLMGHQDPKTTQIYAHLSQEHLEQAARKMKLSE
jgi:integrase